jgi:hypothetical protein
MEANLVASYLPVFPGTKASRSTAAWGAVRPVDATQGGRTSPSRALHALVTNQFQICLERRGRVSAPAAAKLFPTARSN